MLRVTIELLPHGDESQKELLGTATIANTGRSGSLVFGDYRAVILRRGAARRVWRAGGVQRFPRLRLGPWDLLYRVLRECVGARNDENNNNQQDKQ